jgi:peroxiredoxin
MLHRRIVLAIALVAVVIASLIALAPGSAAVSVGSKAPAFKVTTIDGKSIGLADLMDKPTLVVFWARWCPHCRVELPVDEKIWRDLGPKGVNVIAISLDTDTAGAKKFLSDNHITFPVAIVGTGSDLVKSYGISGIPAVFVLDKGAIVKARYAGEVSESTIRSDFAKLGVK